jgi:hypothetical protein
MLRKQEMTIQIGKDLPLPRARWQSIWLAIATSFLLALAPFSARAALNINPFIDCIEPLSDGTGFIANFGYESFETSIVQVAVGTDNFFSPNPANRGQIIIFVPGYVQRAFRVPFSPDINNPSLIWNFLGNRVFANNGVRVCGAAAPNVGITPGPITATLSVTSGGNQTTARNTLFPQPLRITATFNGRPLQGLTLRFTAPTTGASATFAASTVNTDANGVATVNVTANAVAGSYAVRVAVGTSATPVTSITVPLVNQ